MHKKKPSHGSSPPLDAPPPANPTVLASALKLELVVGSEEELGLKKNIYGWTLNYQYMNVKKQYGR